MKTYIVQTNHPCCLVCEYEVKANDEDHAKDIIQQAIDNAELQEPVSESTDFIGMPEIFTAYEK